MMNDRKRLFAAVLTLIVGLALMALKFWAFRLTGSQAVLSDAMESIVNVVAAVSLLIVIWVASKPADANHPYGHGKVEFFSAAFEGGMITFAGLIIIADAIQALIEGQSLRELESGLIITFGAGLVNLALGTYLVWSGRRLNSTALTASGKHVMSDFWTSFGVVVSLGLVKWTGVVSIDAVAAIAFGSFLAIQGIGILKESTEGLMDAEDEKLLKRVLELFTSHRFPGIIRIHYTRIIRSGRYHHIDSHVVLPEYWDVKMAHAKTDQFERDVIRDYEYDGEIHFHLDPCRQAYCRVCDVPSCPIRLHPFQDRIPFTLDELRSPIEAEEFLRQRRGQDGF